MPKKILSVEKDTYVSTENGDVLNSDVTTISIESEPPFYKKYLSDLGLLHKLSASENAVFDYLVSNKMDYNNVIYVMPKIRLETSEALNISEFTVRDAVITFQKRDLFKKIDLFTYVVNPKFVAKGSWEKVKKIRLSYEAVYEKGKEPVKTIKATFE